MSLGSDERAQSTLVGAILLFAILVIAFSSYQAFVVPNQNAEVEFNHNQDVQTDMQDLRNSLLDVRSVRFDENDVPEVVSEHRPVRLRLGTQYPERLIALNPTAPSGTLETEDGTFEIRNADITSSQFSQYNDDLIRSHDTKLIAYEPSYTEYQNPPITRFEHSLSYNDFDSANISTSNQRLIRGLNDDVIDVVLVEGDVSRSSSGSVTIDPETVDGPTERVPIEQDNGPIELEFTTNQPEIWNETLSDISSVDNVTPNGDSVVVELNDGEYDLRMTTVRLEGDGGDGPFTEIQTEPPGVTGNGSESVFDTQWLDEDGNQIDDTILIEPEDTASLIVQVTGRSGEAIQQKQIEQEDLDIAGDVEAFSEFDFPDGNATDANGSVDVDISSSDAASDGDTFETYVTAGDDSDVAVFEVEDEEEDTMTDRVERVDGSSTVEESGGSDSPSDRPRFDFSVTDGEVTIDAAAIETQNDFSEIGVTGPGGSANTRFEIDGERSDRGTDAERNFVYDFDGLTLGTGDGQIGTRFVRLDTEIDNLQFVEDEEDADLVIALRFEDDSIKEFYFEGDVDN